MRDSQTDRHRVLLTYCLRERQRWQTDRQRRQTQRRQTEKRADRQAEIQTVKAGREMEITGRQACRHACRPTGRASRQTQQQTEQAEQAGQTEQAGRETDI